VVGASQLLATVSRPVWIVVVGKNRAGSWRCVCGGGVSGGAPSRWLLRSSEHILTHSSRSFMSVHSSRIFTPSICARARSAGSLPGGARGGGVFLPDGTRGSARSRSRHGDTRRPCRGIWWNPRAGAPSAPPHTRKSTLPQSANTFAKVFAACRASKQGERGGQRLPPLRRQLQRNGAAAVAEARNGCGFLLALIKTGAGGRAGGRAGAWCAEVCVRRRRVLSR
jgi:hypothetical protein